MSDFRRVDEVRTELAGYLTRSAMVPALASSVVALLLAATVYDKTDIVVLGLWLAATIVLNFIRVYVVMRHKPQGDAHWEAETVAGRATLTVAASGILWGFAGGYFFDSAEVITQIMLAFVIGGLAAGSMATYAAWLPAFYAFMVPALVPLTLRFFLEANTTATAMGAMLAVFGVALAFLSHTVNRSLSRSANLQIDKDDLVHGLTQAKFEAESANRAKDEFLSRVSHELRTPMNAILGYGQLLHRDVNPALTDRQRRSVEQIMQAGHHLLDLIDEVLKLGQINAGTIEVDRIDIAVRPMLEDCIGLIQPDAAKRLISIENRTSNMRGVAFIGDNVRVKEVLLNLLSNAVKYNVMHGRIVLTAHRTSDDMIRISVADTGPGIPSDQVERVFDPFTRLESSGENIPGTGIGLTIAKQMVELMGGRIGCTAESDAGTEFWFELPASMTVVDTAANALAGGDAASDASEDAEKNYTLLYVEDNATNQELLRDICSLRPEFSLHCADDAEAGLDVLRHQSIDLVIMDIKLPGIDGFEALRMIRQQPASVAIPVIALSASAMSTDIKRGMEAGFSRYLTKPIDVDQILTAVDQIREEGTVEI